MACPPTATACGTVAHTQLEIFVNLLAMPVVFVLLLQVRHTHTFRLLCQANWCGLRGPALELARTLAIALLFGHSCPASRSPPSTNCFTSSLCSSARRAATEPSS